MAGVTTLCGCTTRHPAIRLYVAPDGRDAWSGKLDHPNAAGTDGPLATLAGARDAIRALRAHGLLPKPVEVLARGGSYYQPEPLVLTPADSGTAAAPIAYAAFPGERPLISGGRAIRGWKQQGNLWTAHLPDVQAGAWDFGALWVDGRRRTPARLPVSGFFRTIAKVGPVTDPGTGKESDRSRICFQYAPGDLRRWPDFADVRVVVLHGWEQSIHRIASLDETVQVVTFTGPSNRPFMTFEAHQRYYIENVQEGLSEPGTWCLERKSGTLYYHPMEGEEMSRAEVIAPVAKQFVLLVGAPAEGRRVEYVTFRDLCFAYSERTVPPEGYTDRQAASEVDAAFQATGAQNCAVLDCEIAHIGNYGVWFRAGCRHNRIAGNHLHDLGAGGVRLGETASPADAELAAVHNVVNNNWIHDGGRIFGSAVGVWIGRSSCNSVSHNEISHLGYTGVSVGWSWGYDPSSANHNIIEHNHIHHLGRGGLSDMGGIYTLGVSPGTIIRGNHIHDVQAGLYGGWGIYPDEGSSEMLIEGNVVHDTQTGGFHQHYGRENRVINNIFAFSGKRSEGQLVRSRDEEHISFRFERNIVCFDEGRLLAGTWKNDQFLSDFNCYWNTAAAPVDFAGATWAQWQGRGHDVHSLVADPLFVDAAKRDFRLRPQSPALSLGFRPVDIRSAGLSGPRKWTEAPLATTHAAMELLQPPTVANGHRGVLRVTLRNQGKSRAGGVIALHALPADACEFADAPRIAYDLAPGQSLSREIRLDARQTLFTIETDGDEPALEAGGMQVRPTPWPIRRLGELPTPEAVPAALAEQNAQVLFREGRHLADVRLALAGKELAVCARVYDPKPVRAGEQWWTGSCLELFTAATPGREVTQLVFLPAVEAMPAETRLFRQTQPAAPSKARWVTARIDGGYELSALVPLTELALAAAVKTFSVEIAVGTSHPPQETLCYSTLSGAGASYESSLAYCPVVVAR